MIANSPVELQTSCSVNTRPAKVSYHLEEAMVGKNNNLNLLRMVLAAAVLLSHSHPLTQGLGTTEPLEAWLHFSLGTLSVYGFFFISGLLVTQSLCKRSNLFDYFCARSLRILPGLAVVVVLTAGLLGPLVTTEKFTAYFADKNTWSYVFANITLFKLQYSLPGVFVSNPYPGAINGSLWSLPFEIGCYVILAALWFVGAFRSPRRQLVAGIAFLLIVVGCAILSRYTTLPGRIVVFCQLAPIFAIGTAFYLARDKIKLSNWAAAGLLVTAATINYFISSPWLFCLAFSYSLACIAYYPNELLLRYNRFGDYSYGLYIYAFPVQQLIVWLCPGISAPWLLSLIAFPVSVLFAVGSWHIIERPAIAFKSWRPA